ncbi:alcohol dehydrogenase catalytic domain-containing protein [Candidatus Sumerlaeota bacterium]|nr:alcohol dehydrogenase catalytic domain-containing protein [Candidatus Sumerlaeota bacterium]
MLRAVLIEPEKILIEEVDKPLPQKGEALIKVEKCGVCGSDIHAYYGKHPFTTLPVVQGHEFSGVIAELGEGVSGLTVGKKVVVEPSLVCGKCYQCRSGRYNICDELRVMGFQAPGAYIEYFPVPAEKVIMLPDDMNLELAAMVEPTAVGVHAATRAGLKGGENVIVIGAGPIGLLLAQVTKALGANKVLIADVIDARLQKAVELGVDYIVNVQKQNLAESVHRVFPDGADVIFEAVGKEATIRDAIETARKGTKIVVVGVFPSDPKVQMGLVQDRELELVGTLMYMRPDFEVAVNLIYSGKINVSPLISARFNMRELQKAYKYIEQNKDTTLKVIITVAQD